ncbi:hypothetical protein [Streptomyces sp. NBC_00893]|uniref:hypothetical protein n=1 Tax=Streptomyces sp. NBC_00893 TaxID=2975862 RepID=UPI00338DCF1F
MPDPDAPIADAVGVMNEFVGPGKVTSACPTPTRTPSARPRGFEIPRPRPEPPVHHRPGQHTQGPAPGEPNPFRPACLRDQRRGARSPATRCPDTSTPCGNGPVLRRTAPRRSVRDRC